MAEKPTYEELENRNQELEQAESEWKQAEKALRESEEKYRSYLEHANDGISVVQKRKFVFVNSRLAEIMGFKVDELEGKDFLQFIPKDKLNQIADNLKRRLAGEEVPQVYESRILHKDSREIDVEFNVTTIEFNDEPATLTITRDITKRKQAEEALQTREKLINALLNNQIDAATVVDKDLKMLYVNEFLAERFGRSVDEMIGLSPEDVGDKADIVTAKRVAYFKQVATTGKPVRFEDKRGEIWFDTVVTPVLDKDGQVSQVAILARDITDKKKIEQALVESEEKYRGLVETMAEGLAIQDENGLIIYVNNRFCKMAGYQQHEVIGKKIIDFLDERNKQIVKGEIAKRRKNVPAHSYETEITRKDGRQISVFLSPRDILDSDGQFKGSFAVFTDISFRIQAEEALQNAHRELEQKVDKRTAKLKETTEQLKVLMNATTDTIFLTDLKGYVVAANAVTAERFGVSLDHFLGTCAYDLMSPSLAKFRKAITNRVVKTRKPHRLEDERRGIVFDSSIYPVFDEGGKVVQLAIYGKDITERKHSEQALKKSEEDLRIKSNSLEEMNTALKILMNSKDEDRKEFEEKILANLKHLVQPYLRKMGKHLTDEKLKSYLHILETNLNNIISPFSQKLSSKYMYLTTTEIEVANLVKEGRNSKDIAEMLGTSYKTIQNHRVNIRKKLEITKKPVNLRTYLSSLQ